MTIDTLNIPMGDRKTVIDPPFSEWGRLIEESQLLRQAPSANIDGESLSEIAAVARTRAVLDAIEYTRSIGLSIPNPLIAGSPVIAAGHQPYPFHPGVAIKSLLISKFAKLNNATPIFISVDSDEFRNEFFIPEMAQGMLKKSSVSLFPKDNIKIFEASKTVDFDDILSRLNKIKAVFDDNRLSKIKENLSKFIDFFLASRYGESSTHTTRAIQMRRAWESEVSAPVLELPVSRLSGHTTFLSYAAHIIKNILQFKDSYNGALDTYRKSHKLRYPANPLPNLSSDGDLIETPFWVVNENQSRLPLYVEGKNLLVTDGASKTVIGSLSDILEGKIKIRPRAITLSIYLRLFVCDLFLHGIGGAKYDSITDPIIKSFYGIDPPPFACASATLHIDAPSPDDPTEKIVELQRLLRDLTQKPENFTGRIVDSKNGALLAKLADEKFLVIGNIKAPGADKKRLGEKISALNKEMASLLKPVETETRTRLKELEKDMAEYEVKSSREYPFFLYDPKEVKKLA